MTPRCLAIALLLVGANGAACELPALPAIPATIGDDVARVLLDVRRYSDAIIGYTDCVKAELAAAGGDTAPALLRSVLVARHNHAVAEHEAVTDLYAARVGPVENLRLAEYVDGEGRDCVLGSSVTRTGVVNDGAVIFFVRGAQAYLNVLEATCPGLERDGQFVVGNQPATGVESSPAARGVISPNGVSRDLDTPLVTRVCDQDRIFPYREAATRQMLACHLGRFFPLEEQQALQILAALGEPEQEPGETDAGDAR